MDIESPLTPTSKPKPVLNFRGQIVGVKKGQQNLGLSDEQWSQLNTSMVSRRFPPTFYPPKNVYSAICNQFRPSFTA